MRLPNGETEVFTAANLEKAFRCGLVDGRTPVRARTSSAWSTLTEAAGLEEAVSSVPPSELELELADVTDSWRGGRCFDESEFRARKGRGIAVAFGMAGALTILCVTAALGIPNADASTSKMEAAPVLMPHPVTELRAMRDGTFRPGSASERGIRSEQRRLTNDDAVRLWKAALKKTAR